jgi:hypothetical protein
MELRVQNDDWREVCCHLGYDSLQFDKWITIDESALRHVPEGTTVHGRRHVNLMYFTAIGILDNKWELHADRNSCDVTQIHGIEIFAV